MSGNIYIAGIDPCSKQPSEGSVYIMNCGTEKDEQGNIVASYFGRPITIEGSEKELQNFNEQTKDVIFENAIDPSIKLQYKNK